MHDPSRACGDLVCLTRDERDALHAEIVYAVEGQFADAQSESFGALRRPCQELRRLFAVLDQIGWDEVGTELRYELDVDRTWLREVIRSHRDDHMKTVAYDAKGVADAVTRNARAASLEDVDGALDWVGRCDVVLAALVATGA